MFLSHTAIDEVSCSNSFKTQYEQTLWIRPSSIIYWNKISRRQKRVGHCKLGSKAWWYDFRQILTAIILRPRDFSFSKYVFSEVIDLNSKANVSVCGNGKLRMLSDDLTWVSLPWWSVNNEFVRVRYSLLNTRMLTISWNCHMNNHDPWLQVPLLSFKNGPVRSLICNRHLSKFFSLTLTIWMPWKTAMHRKTTLWRGRKKRVTCILCSNTTVSIIEEFSRLDSSMTGSPSPSATEMGYIKPFPEGELTVNNVVFSSITLFDTSLIRNDPPLAVHIKSVQVHSRPQAQGEFVALRIVREFTIA